MRFLAALFTFVLLTAPARAQVIAQAIDYSHGTTNLQGAVVFETRNKGKRPCVLLAHELGPLHTLTRNKAVQLVAQGYIVFCMDLFGKGVTPKDGADAVQRLGIGGKDRTLRVAAARQAAEKLPQVDAKRVAGVGFGVGGTALLEHARAKGDLEGIVCIHGELWPGDDGKNTGASILVIAGADDPRVPRNHVTAFEDEMQKGGVDWQVVRIGGVAGDFTNPQAGRDLKVGRAYDPDVDQRANDLIRTFLTEMFAVPVKAVAPPKKLAPKGFPEKVLKVLAYLDEHGEAMDNFEGGRTFGNFEKRLPQTSDKGQRIRYREWDVNPLRAGVNRGAERLVTGSDGSAHYTVDHYATFKKIR